MDAKGGPKTVKIRFAKRMPDGEVRHSAPLYDSSAGFARAEHMLSYARHARDGREGGAFASPALRELEPNFLLTSYIAAAHQEYERGGSLSSDTMAVGDGSWLGNIRVVEEVVLDLDELLVNEEPAVSGEIRSLNGRVWTC